MTLPNISCSITCSCSIYKSEDPDKIQQALANIFGDEDIRIGEHNATLQSSNVRTLKKIFETIRSKGTQKIYRKQLVANLNDKTTWFYLNKQAAYANTVALCTEEEESPLGPIKVLIESDNIDSIIEWLIS